MSDDCKNKLNEALAKAMSTPVTVQEGSTFTNNYVQPRDHGAGPLFCFLAPGQGDTIVNLDGYAIIPMEKYEALTDELAEARQLLERYMTGKRPFVTEDEIRAFLSKEQPK